MDTYEMLDRAWDDLSPEEKQSVMDAHKPKATPLVLNNSGEPDFHEMFKANQKEHDRDYGGHQDNYWYGQQQAFIEGCNEVWTTFAEPALKENHRLSVEILKLKSELNKAIDLVNTMRKYI